MPWLLEVEERDYQRLEQAWIKNMRLTPPTTAEHSQLCRRDVKLDPLSPRRHFGLGTGAGGGRLCE
jgi:hypothetical protein